MFINCYCVLKNHNLSKKKKTSDFRCSVQYSTYIMRYYNNVVIVSNMIYFQSAVVQLNFLLQKICVKIVVIFLSVLVAVIASFTQGGVSFWQCLQVNNSINKSKISRKHMTKLLNIRCNRPARVIFSRSSIWHIRCDRNICTFPMNRIHFST